MRNILNIMKKELKKVLGNPRAFISTIVLPGLMIFLVYSFMGSATDSIGVETNEIYVLNAPDDFTQTYLNDDMLNAMGLSIVKTDEVNLDVLKQEIGTTVDGILYFDPSFNDNLGNGAKVSVIIDSNSIDGMTAQEKIMTLVNDYQLALQGFKPDYIVIESIDISGGDGEIGNLMAAMLIPMLIITFIFAGALSPACDAIAGEKERGTLATLLMAPIKRGDIVLGKIASISIITVLSAISSFIGILASIPFASSMFGTGFNLGVLEYLGTFLVLIAVAIFAVSILLIASTFAKTIKEATAYAMPVYIIAILSSVFNMMQTGAQSLWQYAIPVYNCNLCLKGIITGNINFNQLLLTFGTTIVYVVLLIYVLIKMFKNERILFSR